MKLRNNKIFVSGLFHETHTFLSQPTKINNFTIHLGKELIDKNIGNGSPMDGFLEYAYNAEWEVIPGIQMMAMPSGVVENNVLLYFENEFFNRLESVLSGINGIYLVLHGAMVSTHCDDVEGTFLNNLKQYLDSKGIQIPIVGVLDLHANVTRDMIMNSDCLYCYRKNPHTDAKESAFKAAKLLENLLLDQPVSQLFCATNYILPPLGLSTDKSPMRELLEKAKEIEIYDTNIYCINIFGGYAYADIPDCGFSISICTKGSPKVSEEYFEVLLQVLEDNILEGYPQESLLAEVLEDIQEKASLGKGPVVLVESSDNIGGGAPGDATGLISECIQLNLKNVLAVINDPDAVQECYTAGIDHSIELYVGGKTDNFHGSPLLFHGKITHLSDGQFQLENKDSHLASISGINIEMGRCAVIENDQMKILLTSKKTPPMDLGQLRSQGLSPENEKIIIVKAAVSHKQAYDPISIKNYYIESPGLCSSNLSKLNYTKAVSKLISISYKEKSGFTEIYSSYGKKY